MGSLNKLATGINGLDQVTAGGFPVGRATLICGGAGCGKSLFGIQFLVRGAQQFHEPGVLVSFEESIEDIVENVASLGVDLNDLVAKKKLLIDHIRFSNEPIGISGEFDLDGLYVRIENAVRSIGARRLVLDTIELLFGTLLSEQTLRRELRRFFERLKGLGVTTLVTGERGLNALTRYGFEEYVSDCVISLDHRVDEQISTRRLRVVKYRGSTHGTNEYPFLIDQDGITVLPITSAGLAHQAPVERISTGVESLDVMMDGSGFYRGSSILVSGTAGSGKSSLTAHFVDAACARGEKACMFLFEESPEQIFRNMRSIGINLEKWEGNGLLMIYASRPSLQGLEMHLAMIQKRINDFAPSVVVIDPISSFSALGQPNQIRAMLVRLVDFLKAKGITVLLTSLTHGGGPMEATEQEISSLIDTWLLLRDIESNGERNRGLYILKSRGMKHSNQIREFVLTDHGIKLNDVYAGSEGVLTGAARIAQSMKEKASRLLAEQEIDRQKYALERKRQALNAKIAALEAEFAAEEVESERMIAQEQMREQTLVQDQFTMKELRNR